MTAHEIATVGCRASAGLSTTGLEEPAQNLITYYGLELGHLLFVTATTVEPVHTYAQLWDASDAYMDKSTDTAGRARARTEVLRLCRQAGLSTDPADRATIDATACRMARDLARMRPHLSSYVRAPDEESDPSEPFDSYLFPISLTLNMLDGLYEDFRETGPGFIDRKGTDTRYRAQLKRILARC